MDSVYRSDARKRTVWAGADFADDLLIGLEVIGLAGMAIQLKRRGIALNLVEPILFRMNCQA